ncbi:ABC transporter ATP-binding protein [Marinobacter nanhaiticus D15-8W]|uniref:ABC-type dipeptide transporter n=1 Tax=Marinobacter nanhaiticus D15-8W TaxID=626887 RepID=N6W429_9GAMM|nr:ABC transporter ATP-binding protein [Marinobacter nanhaiticus]ENO17270.1 ABC transporter ATP-binding protein [Marinobacter nanhaiticus D15-8W]BES72137.1 ABC transporter ATP-binding protein [Marinobacter nanhaiticus D15-8W]
MSAPVTTERDKPLLSVEKLSIEFGQGPNRKRVVDDLSFSLGRSQTLCIAGESGSGKSLSALAIMGLLPKLARTPSGAIIYGDNDLLSLPDKQMQRLRGREIGMIFQEPMTSLNPTMRIGSQMMETVKRHRIARGDKAWRHIKAMMDAVKIPKVDERLSQYPHELSGGLRQRVMIAMAMLCSPKVLIADEPTTALDVTIQAQILELIRELQREYGTAVLMITHDMGVVAEMADNVVVMNRGIVEETAPVEKIFTAPNAAYTRKLLAAVPRLGTAQPIEAKSSRPVVLEVENLRVHYPVRRKKLFEPPREVVAVDNISFELHQGETLGIVGESGCGKSTTGRALMNMLDFDGRVRVLGTDIHGLRGERLRQVRQDIQMIFQDPYAALNPRKNIEELVGEPLLIHGRGNTEQRREMVAQLLRQVGLPEADALTRYPHQFSGGQRQRICIARALALKPKIIVSDEPVSALDVSVQAQVLELLESLQQEHDLSYIFISHDMAVVERLCHRVAVMFAGRILEMGSREQVLGNPRHPYTQRLLSAVPIPALDSKRDFASLLEQLETPDPIKPKGHSAPPLRYAQPEEGHFVALEA